MTQSEPQERPKDSRSLSHDDRYTVFRMATRRFAERYASQIAIGMRDKELKQALEDYLGIFGGSGGPDQISIAYQGAGLKIWGSLHGLNHVTDAPLFQGQATIAMAREVYGIADPQSTQLALF